MHHLLLLCLGVLALGPAVLAQPTAGRGDRSLGVRAGTSAHPADSGPVSADAAPTRGARQAARSVDPATPAGDSAPTSALRKEQPVSRSGVGISGDSARSGRVRTEPARSR
jgi:hypothetical protein